MVTRLVAELLGELNLNVREIHSRKPQSYRTRVSDEFRKSNGLILVTSDVSARGVDYPDVTLVVQVIHFDLACRLHQQFIKFYVPVTIGSTFYGGAGIHADLLIIFLILL